MSSSTAEDSNDPSSDCSFSYRTKNRTCVVLGQDGQDIQHRKPLSTQGQGGKGEREGRGEDDKSKGE